MKGWECIEIEGHDQFFLSIRFIAVVPVDDLAEHAAFSVRCWCLPLIQQNGRVIKFTHNSLDNRELFEDLPLN